MIKKWLKLPRNANSAILYHPDVLDVSSVSGIKQKAKISYLPIILQSPDPLLREVNIFLTNLESLQAGKDISFLIGDFLPSATAQAGSVKVLKKSASTLPKITLQSTGTTICPL